MDISSWPLRTMRLLFCAAVTLGVASESARADDAPAVPRYKFKRGQELHYEGIKWNWFEKNAHTELAVSWRVWVLSVNPEGSADLAIEYCEQKKDDKLANRYLFHLKIGPDGRRSWNPTMASLPAWLSARRILPQLPSAEEFEAGAWHGVEPRLLLHWNYRLGEPAEPGHLQIMAVCKGPIEEVSVGSQQFAFEFDTVQGRLLKSDFGGFWKNYDEREEENFALTKATDHDAQWADVLQEDAERFFKAVEAHRLLVGRHDRARLARGATEQSIAKLCDEAKSVLLAAQAANRAAEFVPHYEKCLHDHQEQTNQLKAGVAKGRMHDLAEAIDRPSPAWTAEDLDGTAHALADYRGKVVVLDFWFRKCNYCIRAHPQFEAVVEHFKDKPVAFLGVNIDEDAEDAEFTVEQLKITYPTLRGVDLKKIYPAAGGAPTWVVIDAAGIVRAVHSGYSGLLQEELTETIEALLK